MFEQDGARRGTITAHDYAAPEAFQGELATMFRTSWQFFALRSSLRRPGDQVALPIAGIPVVVRNEGGRLVAFVNICAHRHSLVAKPGQSHAPVLRCPYHGWEYDDAGRLCRLPDGPSFRGLPAREVGLRALRVACLGELVFVSLLEEGPALLDELGEYAEEVRQHFGDHRVMRTWTSEHEVNWKIIAENAVESYHVPCVHPTTFREFRAPELHDHTIHPHYTRYLDLKPWEHDVVGYGVKLLSWLFLGQRDPRRFTQAHLFPGILLYYNALVATLIVLEPLSETRTRHIAISLVPRRIRGGALLRPLQWLFAQVFTRLGERVLREDMRLWPSLQQGAAAAERAAWLGSREERVTAFHHWVSERRATSTKSRSTGRRDAAELLRLVELPKSEQA
ncbi:MAG: aromatic ring-hydroxylating oxygenase subunit alpha [Myxococcota bacterium]